MYLLACLNHFLGYYSYSPSYFIAFTQFSLKLSVMSKTNEAVSHQENEKHQVLDPSISR